MLFSFPDKRNRFLRRLAPGARAIQKQSDHRCIFRTVKLFGHALEPARRGHANRQVEHAFGQLDEAVEIRAAARQHQARGNQGSESAALQFVPHQRQQFLRARLHDFVEHAREHRAHRAIADAGDFDRLVLHDQILIRRSRARA